MMTTYDTATSYPDVKCVFCGAGVVPLTLHGEVYRWNCQACNSQMDGIIDRMTMTLDGEYGPAVMYVDGYNRIVRDSGGRRVRLCPVGLLFIDSWVEL